MYQSGQTAEGVLDLEPGDLHGSCVMVACSYNKGVRRVVQELLKVKRCLKTQGVLGI